MATEVQDIWYASQRVLRTIVQTGVPAFLGFAVVLPQIIDALGLPVDGRVYAWLVAAAAVVTAVAGGLSRVMAIPAVNTWLVSVGLGSVPKSSVTTTELSTLTVNGERVDGTAAVEPAGEGDALVAGDGLATATPATAVSIPKPSGNASRADWEAYAVQFGYDVSEGLNRNELRAKYSTAE